MGVVQSHSGGRVRVQLASGGSGSYEDTSVFEHQITADTLASHYYPEFGSTIDEHLDHPKSIVVSASREHASPGYTDGYEQALADKGRVMQSYEPDYWTAFQKGWGDGLVAREDHPKPAAQTDDLDTHGPSDINTGDQGTLFATAGGMWDFIRGDDTPTKTWEGPGHNPSFDSCAWRRNSRCWYPESINQELTDKHGIMVWNGQDRGYCSRVTWDAQKACAFYSAGPHDGGTGAPMASDFR